MDAGRIPASHAVPVFRWRHGVGDLRGGAGRDSVPHLGRPDSRGVDGRGGKLLDDVRHRSARRLLANTDLGAGEVAFLLGFEEMNSFTRAFHAWEGTSPAQWRATAR